MAAVSQLLAELPACFAGVAPSEAVAQLAYVAVVHFCSAADNASSGDATGLQE